MFTIDDLYAKQDFIKRFFCRRISSQEEIEDLVQDVLYHAIKNIHTLKKQESIDSWIFGICRNILKQHYTKKSKNKFVQIIDIAANDRSYEKIALRILLQELPERLQLLYRFYYVERHKIKDISRILGMPEGSVKYLLHDLRQRFREKIEDAERGADGA